MSNIVLYDLPGCPFCAKVRNKLDELGLDYETVEVPRSRAKRTEVKEVSGQTGVPVLVDEQHGVDGMPESRDIVAYLEETYGDGETDSGTDSSSVLSRAKNVFSSGEDER